jgi:hypothetical protein
MTTGSITTWTRLEPQGQDASLETGVKARLFDPLWLLTRQWQMGEFQAQDGGMPVQARVRSTTAPLSRLRLGPIAANTQIVADAFDPLARPMEALIERRPMRPINASDQRMLPLGLEAGLHFLRMLEAQPITGSYRAAFVARFALQPPASPPPDEPTRRLYSTMAGRALDGRLLAAAIRAGAAQLVADPALAIAAGDQAETVAAANAWLAWWDGFCDEPITGAPDAWAADRMEYGLSVAARLSADPTDEFTLTAGAIDDGRVDWSSFDHNAEVNMGSAPDRKFAADVQTAIPAPVTFRGGPAQRFWEMEEAQIAYGLTQVGPTDLAQLMMIEYASGYGGDWFVIPLDLAAGSVTRIESLVVTDSFGVRTLLRPIGDAALPAPYWSMWQLDFIRYPGEAPVARPVSNLFFLPPVAGRILDGTVLEEVLFARDEMANMSWAIERQIESPAELAVLRDPGAAPAALPASADGPLAYRLASTVPANWIPLLPVQQPGPSGPAIQRLRRGALLQPDGSGVLNPAQGDILEASATLLLYDEDIPRGGLRVTRARRLTRWIDGSTWMWTGYGRQIGRGEASSGLRFDQLG